MTARRTHSHGDYEGLCKLADASARFETKADAPDGWALDVEAVLEVGANVRLHVQLNKAHGEAPRVAAAPERTPGARDMPPLFGLAGIPVEDAFRFTDDAQARETARAQVKATCREGDFLDEAACLRFRAASGIWEPCLHRFVALMFRAALAHLTRKYADDVYGGFCNGFRLSDEEDRFVLASTLEDTYRVRDEGFAITAGDLARRLNLELPDEEHLVPIKLHLRRERSSRPRKRQPSGNRAHDDDNEGFAPPPPPPPYLMLIRMLRKRFVRIRPKPPTSFRPIPGRDVAGSDDDSITSILIMPFLVEKVALFTRDAWGWDEQTTWDAVSELVTRGMIERDDAHPVLVREPGGWRRCFEFYVGEEHVEASSSESSYAPDEHAAARPVAFA